MTVLFILAAAFGQIFFTKETNAADPVEIVTVSVKEGDSLWEIADRYDYNNMDLRKYIEIIQAYNNLENTVLQPGDTIYVPILRS
jgi:LysM repeat protein